MTIPNKDITGAISAIAISPADPNIIYVGAVNGGVWKTTNGTAASPNWVSQTDSFGSLSMGRGIAFDPTDGTFNTVVAGVGRFGGV